MSPASYQTAPPRDVYLHLPCVLRAACPALPDLRSAWRPALRAERAGNGTRTRDPNLGKVVLYQLSYSRSQRFTACAIRWRPADRPGSRYEGGSHGGEGNRTPDLLNAIQALSQLSYTPGRRAG